MADKKISALPAATTPLVGTEVLPIVQGGVTDQVSVANLTVGRDVSVKKLNPTDNVVMAAGKGIDFSTNGGDVLSQYDEGTWTPVVAAGSGTITTVGAVVGNYTRIGRVVNINASIAITNNGTGAGSLNITGLPFNASTNVAIYTGSGQNGSSAKMICPALYSPGNTIYCRFYDGTYPVSSGETIYISASYIV